MRLHSLLVAVLAVAVVSLACRQSRGQTTYYVSPTGSDSADGLTAATAWRSVDQANQASLGAGDNLLFERGGLWRDSLQITAHGTAAAPVTIGAYGTGAAPLFRGSESLSAGGWTQSATNPGTYYRNLTPEATDYFGTAPSSGVSSVLSNQNFLNSSSLATDSGSVATNLNYVHSRDNSWYFDSAADRLYVNPANPADLGGMEAVTRPIGVEVSRSEYVVVRDITVDNTAAVNNSYSVNVVSSDNVRLDSITAYRAGKHHFSAINSDNFVGRNLTARQVMPQLGNGGASSFVSFSDGSPGSDDSTWINVVSDLSGSYTQPAYVDHGGGLGTVKIIGMKGINSSFASTSSGLILRDSTFDRFVRISGNGSLVEGLQLIDSNGPLRINGDNVVVENLLIDNTSQMLSSYGAAIVVEGANASLRFLTVDADQIGGSTKSMIALVKDATNLELIGSVFTNGASIAIIDAVLNPEAWQSMTLERNFFGVFRNGQFLRTDWTEYMTLAELQAMGLDQFSSELSANPYTIGPDGMYRLDPDSGLVEFVPLDEIDFELLTGVYGSNRWQTGGYDAGAVVIPAPVPEPASLLLTAGALGGLAYARRRRRRKSNRRAEGQVATG